MHKLTTLAPDIIRKKNLGTRIFYCITQCYAASWGAREKSRKHVPAFILYYSVSIFYTLPPRIYLFRIYCIHMIPLHFYCRIDVPQSAGVLYTVHIREWVDGGCDILDPSAAIFHRPRCSIVVLLIYSKREKNCLRKNISHQSAYAITIRLNIQKLFDVHVVITCIPSLNKKYTIYMYRYWLELLT